MTFGQALKKEMDKNDISTSELAKRIGKSRECIWRIITGRAKQPQTKTMQKILEVIPMEMNNRWR